MGGFEKMNNGMTTPTESNEGNKKEVAKDGLSGAWALWAVALSPLAWFLMSIRLEKLGQDIGVMTIYGLLWTITVMIIVVCALIYFSWQNHYKSALAVFILLLLNLGILFLEFLTAYRYAG